MPEKRYSVFEYMYRDASNYKQFETLLLRGQCTAKATKLIENKLYTDGHFVPEFVSIPPLQSRFEARDFPSEDDHIWHEYIALRKATKQEIQTLTCWGDLEALAANFGALPGWGTREMFDRIALLMENEPYNLLI